MTPVQPTEATGGGPHLLAQDGLRGVAIPGVLLLHTRRLPRDRPALRAVRHLITDLLLREVEATGAVWVAALSGRRIRRLPPAPAAMLAGVTVAV